MASCWQVKCCGKEAIEFGWCTRTPGEACGWPPKTVRAILALLVVIISMLSSLMVIIFLVISKEWVIAVGAMGTLLSIGTGVLGYYFGYRSGAKPTDIEAPNSKDSKDNSESD